MSESEPRPIFPSGDTLGVYGEHVDIALSTPDALSERLGKAIEEPQKLIDSELLDEELPYPIERITLDALGPQPGDTMPVLHASVDLSIDAIDAFSKSSSREWERTFFHMLNSFLQSADYKTNKVSHDTNTIHVRLDPHYAVSIKLTSDLTGSTVVLFLETIDDLENALGEMSETPPDELSEPVIVTQHFAASLSAVLDAALETFDSPRSIRHLIELTPLVDKQMEMKLAQAALALTEPAYPDRERRSRERNLDRLPGLFMAKERLKEIAEDYGESEAAFLYEVAPTHFLLYGPPGTGKSSLVKAFADDINAHLKLIPTSSVHGENVGSSAKNLQTIFDEAFEKNQPQVLFFDEFETIARIRNSTSNHLEARKLLQQLIVQTSKEHPEIVIAAAMNADKDDIEPALIRSGRLETVSVGLPTFDERLDIITTILTTSLATKAALDTELATLDPSTGVAEENFVLYNHTINCIDFAEKTDGYSIADITEVFDIARRFAYRRYKATNVLEAVSNQDIANALDRLRHR